MVTIFMMSAKMANLGLHKIMVLRKKDYGVTNKTLTRD